MKYTEWLRETGLVCDKSDEIEKKALLLSQPLADPQSPQMESIRRIVIHHSATETGNAALFRVLHRMINGWNDIGYHYVIGNGSYSDDGEIEKGRLLPFKGAHAKGGNHDSIGICLVGNFNLNEPSALQLSSLSLLLRALILEYSLDIDSITLHRLVEGSSTECPGSKISLEDIRYLAAAK